MATLHLVQKKKKKERKERKKEKNNPRWKLDLNSCWFVKKLSNGQAKHLTTFINLKSSALATDNE